MKDKKIIKAFDILYKFEFFGGQRAGRELWNEKPVDVQNKDIENFLKDTAFLKDFINRQQTEVERLQKETKEKTEFVEFLKKEVIDWKNDYIKLKEKFKTIKSEAINEFAESLKEKLIQDIDNLVKEMAEDGTNGGN